MANWNRAIFSDDKFRAVWSFHNGSRTAIAKHLRMSDRRVGEIAARLGLTRHEYLTPRRAGELLGLSQDQVVRYCARGEIAAFCIPSKRARWQITREAVEAFGRVHAAVAVRPYTADAGYVSSTELARLTNYHLAEIQHLCASGAIRAERTRRIWQVPQAEVDRLLAEIRQSGRINRHPGRQEMEPKIREVTMYPTELGPLLRVFVLRSGRSGNQVALAAGIDPAALNRAMTGKRGMGRESIAAVARTLRLTAVDHNRLLVAAGLAPGELMALGYDETFDMVADALGRMDAAERESFRAEVVGLAQRWRGQAQPRLMNGAAHAGRGER